MCDSYRFILEGLFNCFLPKGKKEKKLIIMIGKNDQEDFIKVKEFIEDHYFGKNVRVNNDNEEETFYDNELSVICNYN